MFVIHFSHYHTLTQYQSIDLRIHTVYIDIYLWFKYQIIHTIYHLIHIGLLGSFTMIVFITSTLQGSISHRCQFRINHHFFYEERKSQSITGYTDYGLIILGTLRSWFPKSISVIRLIILTSWHFGETWPK